MISLAINTPLSAGQSRYSFQRNDGAYLDVPKSFLFETPDISRRISVGDKLRQDGGIVQGDGTYQERRIQMRYSIAYTDNASYRSDLNTIESFFRRDQRPYYLIDKDNDIRTEIIISKHGVKEPAGNQNRVAINSTLDLVMVDGMWEDNFETFWPGGDTGGSGESVTMTDGQEETLTVSGLFDVFPVLEITAVNNVVSFILENTTINAGFEFDSNDFLSGKGLVFSSVDGTVYLDGVEASAYITRGGPIILQPGANVLRYESSGGDITLSVNYRNRYAF